MRAGWGAPPAQELRSHQADNPAHRVHAQRAGVVLHAQPGQRPVPQQVRKGGIGHAHVERGEQQVGRKLHAPAEAAAGNGAGDQREHQRNVKADGLPAIRDELPGPAPSVGHGADRPGELLDRKAAQQEGDDAQPHVAGDFHHYVGDVARANLPAFKQEKSRLHQEDEAAHGEQPQPINVGFQIAASGAQPDASPARVFARWALLTDFGNLQGELLLLT